MTRNSLLPLVALTLMLSGCFSGAAVTNMTPVTLLRAPQVSSYQDPSLEISTFNTFSILPESLIASRPDQTNRILEKQLLFFLRSQLEAKGYRFIKLNKHPDFIVRMHAAAQHKASYVPPRSITSPEWVPGEIITTKSNTSGTYTLNTSGEITAYGGGSYSGSTTSQTRIPGHMENRTYTTPGHHAWYYYPDVGIALYDTTTHGQIWLGKGRGVSDNPDIRISAQFVINRLLQKLPDAAQKYRIQNKNDGILGVAFGVYTTDGNHYLPVIMQMAEHCPAERAGLRLNDMVISIDGKSVVNKPLSYVTDLLKGPPDTVVTFHILRMGKNISAEVTRTARNDWKLE